MSVTHLVGVNANSGAYTRIAATIIARAAQIIEDGSVTPQGLEVQYPGDAYATTNTVPYGQQPISIAGPGHDGVFLPIQNPENATTDFNYRPADVYCQVRSATATATTVRVVETETV